MLPVCDPNVKRSPSLVKNTAVLLFAAASGSSAHICDAGFVYSVTESLTGGCREK